MTTCDIDDVRGLRYAVNLTHLSVCSCRNITSESFVLAPENLDTVFSQITQPLKLRKLEWYNSLARISSQFIRTIATQMPHMRHLEWTSFLPNESTSTEEDFHLLVRNCRNLEIFRILGSTPMTSQSLMCMGQSLIMLRQLKLGRSEPITDAGVQALAQGCRFLEYLDGCARLTDHALLTLNVETLHDLDISGTFILPKPT
eukprot:gene7931-9453_t